MLNGRSTWLNILKRFVLLIYLLRQPSNMAQTIVELIDRQGLELEDDLPYFNINIAGCKIACFRLECQIKNVLKND